MLTILIGSFSSKSIGQEIQVVEDVPGSFIDISGSKPLRIGDDEEIQQDTTIGNFVFPAGSIIVANNGGVAFRMPPSSDLGAVNQPIPTSSAFGGGQAILAYWDDLNDKDGDVFVVEQSGRLVVQWNNRALGASPANTVRFQLQIPEDPGPTGIVAQIVFSDIEQLGAEGGLSATIGYQDGGAGFGDFQWSFDTQNAVTNGTVLSLRVWNESADAVPLSSNASTVVASLVIVLVGIFAVRNQPDLSNAEAGDST